MNSGDEDDGRFLVARMLPDHIGQIESVHVRHADVHEHDGDVVPKKQIEGLAAGVGLDQILPQLRQDRFVAEQLTGLIVDHQDVYFVGHFVTLQPATAPSGAATFSTWKEVGLYLPVSPDIPRRQLPGNARGRPSWPWRSAR